jgi:RNA polymerase-binding transcription factor DksA
MAANAYTKELLMSMSTNDRQLPDSIERWRIEEGEYGYCDNCSEPTRRSVSRPAGHALCDLQEMNEKGLLVAEEE